MIAREQRTLWLHVGCTAAAIGGPRALLDAQTVDPEIEPTNRLAEKRPHRILLRAYSERQLDWACGPVVNAVTVGSAFDLVAT